MTTKCILVAVDALPRLAYLIVQLLSSFSVLNSLFLVHIAVPE